MEVARRGTFVTTLTPRTTGFVGQRRGIFKTLCCHEIYDVVFLFLKSPSCYVGFPFHLVSVHVIGAWFDIDLCVQVGLEVIWFHMICWSFPVF